jgi:hypothetical protein
VTVGGQFVPELLEVGQRPSHGTLGLARAGTKQLLLQPVVVEVFCQRLTQASLLETGQILADGTLADLDAARDLPLRHLQSEVQPQHVVDFSHGDSLSGHPLIKRDTR